MLSAFPLAVGATAVLMAERPTPAAVFKRLQEHRPTIFYGVPTLFGALLASPDLPTSRGRGAAHLRLGRRGACRLRSAGAGPSTFGVEILDGIGSTEMLHIFLSNLPGEVRYGTTGKPVPGYQIRLMDEYGQEVASRASWASCRSADRRARSTTGTTATKSQATFVGPWTRAGDKYSVDKDGYYTYGGRSDDMLKVSGMYVSPFEVEAALLTHPDVLEAAVIGAPDEQQLIKPKAFVVTKPGVQPGDALAEALKHHVKDRLAPYKYPRWVEFLSELPKTATGKIQRFKLRARE